jgi:hypothetical protein
MSSSVTNTHDAYNALFTSHPTKRHNGPPPLPQYSSHRTSYMSRGHQILTAISPLYLFALVIVLLTTTIGLVASLNTAYQQIGAVRISLGKISSEMAKISGFNVSDAPVELGFLNDVLNNHVGLAEQLLKQNTDLKKDNVRLKNRTAEVCLSGCRNDHGTAAECRS